MRGSIMLAGLLLIGLSYVPRCGTLFPAGVGVCLFALGLPLLAALPQ